MTDITELAQQELAQLRAELSNQAIGSKDHLRKIALSLVDKLEKCRDREIRWLALSDEKSKIITDQEEALEKAQAKADVYDMLRDDYGLRKKGVGLADFVDWQANRIAELESRTVKLPKLKMLEDYLAEVAIEERKQILVGVKLEFHRALAAAGIKVEAE